jgi:hypothetical protein
MTWTSRWGLATAVTLLAACAVSDTTAVKSTAPGRPLFSHDPDNTGTPDLIVDAAMLGSSWVMYDETIPVGSCVAIEGEVTPGDHRLLRFSVSTPNIGSADMYVGDPNTHFDPNGDGDPSDSDGLFEYATCHRHFHFRNYATYQLYPILPDGSLGPPMRSAKRGFCMLDITPFKSDETPPKAWNYRACGLPARDGNPAIPGNQGISTGWADQYFKALSGQFFVVDDIPEGPYLIRIVVNPPFVPKGGEPCPHTDSQGFCHMLPESEYANNVGEVRIFIPAGRAGKKGWGPGGGQELPADVYSLTDDEKRGTSK